MIYKSNDIITLGGIKFTFKEIEEEFFKNDNKFIVSYKTIYQVFYSENAGFSTVKIFYNYDVDQVGLTKKGRFIWSDAHFINKFLNFELLHI